MTEYAQVIKGDLVTGGDLAVTDLYVGAVGLDTSDKYILPHLSDAGYTILDPLTNATAVWTRITDGEDDLDVGVIGEDVGTGILALAEDPSGKLQSLKLNASGELVVTSSGIGNATFVYDSATAQKDDPEKVVSQVGSATMSVGAITVSGLGLCEWNIWFGTTASEAVILTLTTTPACPTQTYNFPEALAVSATQTIFIEATNREKAVSPASDFTAYATIIRTA